MNYDTSNEMFGLAAELIRHSSCNVFLTGKAGTGKTTFLKYIRENCTKQMAVVAPTGVAAINAGGVTIHSFFQLPLSPFIPETKGLLTRNEEITNPHSLLSRLRMNNEKKRLLHELELLIIDEISMVRGDVLDAIDLVLRHIRHRHLERFGGVQVLFIGDMFQLPPVTKEDEWRLLSDYYRSPYFFDSKVIKEDPPVYIEFTKVYRQSEEQFINLLNQVRNNQVDGAGEAILQSRYQPGFHREGKKDYIVLTTHNEKARNINASELAKLNNKLFTYKSEIQNDFSSTAYPADELLHLKVGAQVMFIKNDSDKSKRYFNGKIGVIAELDDHKILVNCTGESSEIEVKKEKWENIRYALNKSTRHLEEEVLGSFTQYPLRLAWAVTIHKSQGLTFEKAIIDAGEAFAAGQVYVALSRCTNLEGMILHSRIRSNSLFTDEKIQQFSKSCSTTDKLQKELEEAKAKYQQKILVSVFEFDRVAFEIKAIQE
jgi:ATP-dependent exoDNAse (exonuclease V) alpha subunit